MRRGIPAGGYGGGSPHAGEARPPGASRARTEVLADRILLYVADAGEALTRVREAGLEPLTELVRRSTLEDVFLYLTGRQLVD